MCPPGGGERAAKITAPTPTPLQKKEKEKKKNYTWLRTPRRLPRKPNLADNQPVLKARASAEGLLALASAKLSPSYSVNGKRFRKLRMLGLVYIRDKKSSPLADLNNIVTFTVGIDQGKVFMEGGTERCSAFLFFQFMLLSVIPVDKFHVLLVL